MPKRYNQPCPVAKSLEVLGDRWTLLVVRDLLRGTQRFQDLLTTLPGIAPNILSARLKLMEEHGLIVREFYSEHPPRAQYALSDKGRELGMVVGALAAWGGRHVYKQTKLVHAGCAHPVSVGYYCPDCGEGVRGADVTVTRARTRPWRPCRPRGGARSRGPASPRSRPTAAVPPRRTNPPPPGPAPARGGPGRTGWRCRLPARGPPPPRGSPGGARAGRGGRAPSGRR